MAGEFNWVGELNIILSRSAVESVRREAQQAFSSINAEVKLGVSPQSRASLDGLTNSAGALRSALRELAAESASKATPAIRETAAVARDAGNAFDDFGHRIDLSLRRVASFSVAAGSLFAVTRALKESVAAAAQFETEMTRLDQIGGLAQGQIKGIGDEIGKLSTRFGTSSSGLAAMAVSLRQAGQSAEQTEASLSAVSKAALVPGFADLRKTTEHATDLFREFGIAGKELESTFASVNAISKQFGTTSEDVLSGVTKAGAAFKQAGGSATELAAIVASLRKETGDSGEAIGGSLRQIFQRFQRPASIASLRELGVELTHTREEALALGQANLEGTFVGPLAAIKRLGAAIGSLPSTDGRVNELTESLGVPRSASKVLSALTERDNIQKAVNASLYAELDLNGQVEKSQSTLSSQVSRLREQFLELGRAVYADEGFKTFLSNLVKISSVAVTLADNLRPLIPLATAFAAVKIGTGIGSFVGGFARGPGPQPRLASGGIVPGHGDGDSIHALLTPGEFVVRKAAARAIGYPQLHSLNAHGTFPASGLPRFATGGVVGGQQGEVHSLQNFPENEFQSLFQAVRAEAARLQVALSSATRVFVQFGEQGPVFAGFPDAIKEIKRASIAKERISFGDATFQASLAKELVGTKASRAKLVERGFLAPEISEAITAGPAERPLTENQIRGRVNKSERANRLQALEAFYRSHEADWERTDLDINDLVPPNPFARRPTAAPSQATIATSSRALVPYVSRSLVPYSSVPPAGNDIADAEFTVRDQPLLLRDRRRRPSPRSEARAAGQQRFGELNVQFADEQIDRTIYGDLPLFRNANYDRSHPEEAAYQRTTLGAAGFAGNEEFRRRIEEREAKRAGTGPFQKRGPRTGGDQLFDPLERREHLRSVGYTLQDELGDQATQLRAARRAARRPEYASSTLDELAQGRADVEVGRRGGPDLISQKTKQAVLAQQREAVEQELVAVTARQLAVLRPGIAKQEALNIAAEQLAQATTDNAKVLRDSRGRVLGLASNVASLPENVRPDVRTRIGGFLAGKFPSLERFGGLSNIGFFGASVAGSYAAAGLDSAAGSGADAVAAGSEGRFRGYRAAGSTLQGALIGGAVGSAILPGWGTAIGAAVGGLHAFASSLGESTKSLQEVRIANASSDFSENLKAIAVPGADFSTFQTARKNLGTIRSEQTERNRSQATSFLGNLDVEEFAGLQRKGQRDALGGQLPQIGGYLSRQADDLAKSNLGVEAKELAGRLRDGGNGLNREFISIIASLRGTSIEKVVGDFTKTILEAQRSARLQQDAQRVQAEQDKTLNAFGRLTQAAELASNGLISLQSQSHSIGDVFSGRVSATPVGGLSELLSHPGNPNRGEYLGALTGVSSLLGPGGVRLRETGQAASDLERVLPSVLSQVLGQNPLDESDFASRTRGLTRSALGFKEGEKLPDQLGRGLDSVISGLNQHKLADLVKSAGNDVSQFSKKLLEEFSAPVSNSSVKIARELEKNANLFIGELVAAAHRASAIRESAGRVDTLVLSSQRQAAIFRADELGKQHSVLDLLSLDQLQRPFNERQIRLAQVQGPAAFDPANLAARLREVREQIGPATERQNQALLKFGGGQQVDAASAELIRLKERAQTLTESLSHLTDASRNAAAQEKLSALQGDKEGRLGLLRRYVLGSEEDRIHLSRGSLLAVQAAHTGLASLTPEDARTVLHFTDSAGSVRLRGIPGAPTGTDFGNRLLADLAPDIAQHPKDRAEEASLKAEITQNNKAAVDAQQALLTNLGELNREAAATTKRLQEEFFSRLRDIFSRDALTDKSIQQAKVGADLGSLRGLATQRNILARVGVTDDIGVERIRGASLEIEQLAAGKKKGLEARERVGEAIAPEKIEQLYRGTYGDIEGNAVKFRFREQTAFDSKSRASLADALGDPGKGFGFAAPDVAKILSLYEERGKEAVDREHRGALTPAGALIGDNRDLLKASLRSSILTVGEEAARRDGADAVNAARRRLSGKGLDVGRLEREISDDGSGAGQLVKAAGAFGPDNRLSTLEDRLTKTVLEFDGLGNAIRRLRAEIDGAGVGRVASPVEHKATGGPIAYRGFPGSPHGTDTVPAWLTEGEYVLPKHIYQKNKELVHAMHNGVAHLADGGPVDAAKLFPAIARQLQREAIVNPATESGRLLFGLQNFDFGKQQFKKGFEQSLARNYYAQKVAGAARRSAAANLVDPWAHFGLGRPGSDAQQAIAARQADYRTNPENLQVAGHHGIAANPAWGPLGAALLRAREAAVAPQRFPGGFGVAPPGDAPKEAAVAVAPPVDVPKEAAIAAPARAIVEEAPPHPAGAVVGPPLDPPVFARLPGDLGGDHPGKNRGLVDAAVRVPRGLDIANQIAAFRRRQEAAAPPPQAAPGFLEVEADEIPRGVAISGPDTLRVLRTKGPSIRDSLRGGRDAAAEERAERLAEYRRKQAAAVNDADAAAQLKDPNSPLWLNPGAAAGGPLFQKARDDSTYKFKEQGDRRRLEEFEEGQRAANARKDAARGGRTLIEIRQAKEREERERQEQAAAGFAEGGQVFDPLARRKNVPYITKTTDSLNFRVSASKDQMNGRTDDSGPSFAVPARIGSFGIMEALAARARRYRDGGHVTEGSGVRDDQHAVLSRGEYVLNQRATRAIGPHNLDRINHFALGGVAPRYYQDGGSVGGSSSPAGGSGSSGIGPVGFSQDALAALTNFNSGLSSHAQSFLTAANTFGSRVERFEEATKKIPQTIELRNHGRLEVIFNGAEVLSRIMPELQTYFQDKMAAEIRKAFKSKMPEA